MSTGCPGLLFQPRAPELGFPSRQLLAQEAQHHCRIYGAEWEREGFLASSFWLSSGNPTATLAPVLGATIKQHHTDGCRDPREKGGGAKRRSKDLNQPLDPFHGDISITCPAVTSPGSQPNPPCPPGCTAKEQRTILGCQQQLARGWSPTSDSLPCRGTLQPLRGWGSRLTALTRGSWKYFPSKTLLSSVGGAQLCSFSASSLPKGQGRWISSLPARLPAALRKRACSSALE